MTAPNWETHDIPQESDIIVWTSNAQRIESALAVTAHHGHRLPAIRRSSWKVSALPPPPPSAPERYGDEHKITLHWGANKREIGVRCEFAHWPKVSSDIGFSFYHFKSPVIRTVVHSQRAAVVVGTIKHDDRTPWLPVLQGNPTHLSAPTGTPSANASRMDRVSCWWIRAIPSSVQL